MGLATGTLLERYTQGHWVEIDGARPCNSGQIPQDLFFDACETC